MKKIIYISILLLSTHSLWSQYDQITDHYLVNSLPLNPAFSGSKEALSANLTYRRQWTGITNAPTSINLGVHSSNKENNLGFGMVLFNNKVGISQKSGALASLAYKLKTPRGNLSFGLGAGIENFSNKWSDVQSLSTQDNTFNQGDETFWEPNISAGIYYYSSKFFASLSSPFMFNNQFNNNVFDPSEKTYSFQDSKLNLILGYTFEVHNEFKIRPSMMIKRLQNSPIVLDINGQVIYKDLIEAGIMWTPKEAFAGILKFQATDQFSIAYSLDFNLNEIAQYNNGSHELSLIFEMVKRTKSKSTSVF